MTASLPRRRCAMAVAHQFCPVSRVTRLSAITFASFVVASVLLVATPRGAVSYTSAVS